MTNVIITRVEPDGDEAWDINVAGDIVGSIVCINDDLYTVDAWDTDDIGVELNEVAVCNTFEAAKLTAERHFG